MDHLDPLTSLFPTSVIIIAQSLVVLDVADFFAFFNSGSFFSGKKRKNSQLSFLPSQFKDEALQQWCHEQITKRKSLQNKVRCFTLSPLR